MRRSILFLLALTALTLQAQRKFTVNITPDGKANMVCYLPAQPTGRAIVDLPGGGYTHLATQHEGHDWATWFNDQGIAFFVVTYRMPGGDRTIPMGDAQQAIRTVRDSAKVWQINPYDVGIMGFSAGGHLASTVSTHSELDCRPNFSILFYPVISMNERETHSGSVNGFLGKDKGNKELVKQFSNQNAVRVHETPPAIILLANDDRAVPPVTNGIAYYSAMRRAGNECALHVYPTGGHGFGFRPAYKFHDQMLGDLKTWLDAHKSPKADAVRVACIGNSITEGMGIEMAPQRGYPAQLQQLLGSGYNVQNYGVSARTLLKNGDIPYVRERAWRDAKAFDADIVVIKLGTNDAKEHNWNKHGQEFAADLQAMIDTLRPMVPVLDKRGRPTKKLRRADRPRIILCSPIRAFEDKWGITDSVIVNGVMPAVRQVAEKNKLEYVDLHEVITDAKDMTGDKIHPNDKGAGLMAKRIAEAIQGAK